MVFVPLIVPAAMYNVGLGFHIRYKTERVYKLGGEGKSKDRQAREQ